MPVEREQSKQISVYVLAWVSSYRQVKHPILHLLQTLRVRVWLRRTSLAGQTLTRGESPACETTVGRTIVTRLYTVLTRVTAILSRHVLQLPYRNSVPVKLYSYTLTG